MVTARIGKSKFFHIPSTLKEKPKSGKIQSLPISDAALLSTVGNPVLFLSSQNSPSSLSDLS